MTQSRLETLITADNKQFLKAIKDSQAEAKKLSNTLKNDVANSAKSANTQVSASFRKVQSEISTTTKLAQTAGHALKDVGKSLIAGFVGVGIIETFKSIGEGIDNTIASANKLDISVKTFQALSYAAKQTDTDISTLEMGLTKLRTVLAAAKPGDTIAGLSTDKLKLKDVASAYLDIANSVNKMGNEYDRVRALNEAFGAKGGQAQANLVRSGAGFASEFLASGKGLNEKDVAIFDKLDEETKRLASSIQDNLQKAFIDLAPAIIGLGNALSFLGSRVAAGIAEISRGIGEGASAARDAILGDGVGQTNFGKESTIQNMVAQAAFDSRRGASSIPNLKNGSQVATVINDVGEQMTKLAAAAIGATAGLTSVAKASINSALGLNGSDGQQYLNNILKPQEQVQDKSFNAIANQLKSDIASGADVRGVRVQSGIASLNSIANSYKGNNDGRDASGLIGAAKILTDATKNINENKEVKIKLEYDQNGIIKAVIDNPRVTATIQNATKALTANEAQATGF